MQYICIYTSINRTKKVKRLSTIIRIRKGYASFCAYTGSHFEGAGCKILILSDAHTYVYKYTHVGMYVLI